MEAIILRGSLDQSISPHQPQFRNPRQVHHHNHPFYSNHSENFSPPNFNTAGPLQAPPPPLLSRSYPPYSLQQPSLLPLPAAGKKSHCNYKRTTRDTSLTPKKSKPSEKLAEKPQERVVGSQTPGQLGPEPKALPNNVGNMFGDANNLFSGSATFTISPPPSSLPLPTFPLRPKLSCRAAVGIDAGATYNLRRLLGLR